MNETQEPTLEETFKQLDDILERIQQPTVTLEEAFVLYEKGIRDIRRCSSMLDGIEKKMLVLSDDGETSPLDEQKEKGKYHGNP